MTTSFQNPASRLVGSYRGGKPSQGKLRPRFPARERGAGIPDGWTGLIREAGNMEGVKEMRPRGEQTMKPGMQL